MDEAVREKLIRDTLSRIKERSEGTSPGELQQEIDEAVAWARENRS